MMSIKCIVHFQPVERYPPAFNLLRVLAEKKKPGDKIFLLTTEQAGSRGKMEIPGVKIFRIFKWKPGIHRIMRMIQYGQFILVVLIKLIGIKPDSLLYYETASAGAPYFYTGFFNRKCRLLIHYHEYTSPQELTTGMLLFRWLHKLERKMYSRAVWVSHTNEDRMRMFVEDESGKAPEHRFIFPNYPPESWLGGEVAIQKPVGLVYVGALSTDHFYLKEFASWVAANADTCFWDIYSDNHTSEAEAYLKQLNAPNIHFKGAVNYDQLPQVLSQYQVGLVLYNGFIPNQVYLVPNKLFEYYVCGLDTWFPTKLLSCHPLITNRTYPKIVEIDFERMPDYSVEELIDKSGYTRQQKPYTCESVSRQIQEVL